MLWVGDREAAADASSSLVSLFENRVSSRLEQRRLERLFEECADIVAAKVMRLIDHEFSGVPENEINAAVLAVHDTFANAALSSESLFRADLDARLLERHLRPASAEALRTAVLSAAGEQMYTFLLRESCAYLVETITTLPRFQAGGFREILSRQTLVLEKLQLVS